MEIYIVERRISHEKSVFPDPGPCPCPCAVLLQLHRQRRRGSRRADGRRLRGHLEEEYCRKKNTDIYWDDVAMFCYPEEYQLGIRPMNRDDIIEVDNLSELVALDESYKKYVEEN